jgi:hypothetical protein
LQRSIIVCYENVINALEAYFSLGEMWGLLTYDLMGLIGLIVIGLIILLVIKLIIVLIPAAIVAAVVYFLTGSMWWAGLAFLVVAALSVLKKL